MGVAGFARLQADDSPHKINTPRNLILMRFFMLASLLMQLAYLASHLKLSQNEFYYLKHLLTEKSGLDSRAHRTDVRIS